MKIPDDRGIFKLDLTVTLSDIDGQGHVNNVVYLRWVQEVAFAHWDRIGSIEMKRQWKWVVLRHEIDYHVPAFLSDSIEAYTWIDKPQGPRQNRYVCFRRTSDHKDLAASCTTWCLLDASTGRPRRVPNEITESFGLKHGS